MMINANVEYDFNQYVQKQLQQPEFKQEYDKLEPEFAMIQALIDARKGMGMTQKELAEKTGIAQGDISKIEHGKVNVSLATLKRLAEGMGKQLKIEFV